MRMQVLFSRVYQANVGIAEGTAKFMGRAVKRHLHGSQLFLDQSKLIF